MRNTISCQECGKGLIFPTISRVECDDFSIFLFFYFYECFKLDKNIMNDIPFALMITNIYI